MVAFCPCEVAKATPTLGIMLKSRPSFFAWPLRHSPVKRTPFRPSGEGTLVAAFIAGSWLRFEDRIGRGTQPKFLTLCLCLSLQNLRRLSHNAAFVVTGRGMRRVIRGACARQTSYLIEYNVCRAWLARVMAAMEEQTQRTGTRLFKRKAIV